MLKCYFGELQRPRDVKRLYFTLNLCSTLPTLATHPRIYFLDFWTGLFRAILEIETGSEDFY